MHQLHKKSVLAAIAGTAAAFLVIGGVYAYMSDAGKAGNVFTVGKISITAQEPKFPTKDSNGNGVPDACEKMIPYREIDKNPSITNTGKNPALVYMEVYVPVENIIELKDSGDAVTGDDDLFWFKNASDSEDSHKNSYDSTNWLELKDFEKDKVAMPESIVGKDNNTTMKKYVFAYKTVLDPGKKTTDLFGKIQNKRYGSAEIGPDEVENIIIRSYAIQSDYAVTDGNLETPSSDNLKNAYSIIAKQNGLTESGVSSYK